MAFTLNIFKSFCTAFVPLLFLRHLTQAYVENTSIHINKYLKLLFSVEYLFILTKSIWSCLFNTTNKNCFLENVLPLWHEGCLVAARLSLPIKSKHVQIQLLLKPGFDGAMQCVGLHESPGASWETLLSLTVWMCLGS